MTIKLLKHLLPVVYLGQYRLLTYFYKDLVSHYALISFNAPAQDPLSVTASHFAKLTKDIAGWSYGLELRTEGFDCINEQRMFNHLEALQGFHYS